jgi:putative ABC transport system permease protein
MQAMFSKIAINNVKRSFKDYSIYFLTLTIAVCIFYSFNSIEAQSAIVEMSQSTLIFMETINKFMAGTSVFVSFILGGLIIYANNFLIKKRKKELGIYMTLGMSKRKISKILFFETLLIGLLSLIVGIALGILVSQGLSVITAQLLSADMKQYKFIISFSAIMKSAIYIGIIYLCVIIFNQVTIARYKLIDLLHASKKNEEVKLSNSLISILTFIFSVVILVIAYMRILNDGVNSEGTELLITVLLGIIGTLLFFFSLSNFFIHIVQKSKKIYFKDLNIFVLRQINNKINTNFLSMTVICLMLFLTITLLFTMLGYKNVTDRSLVGNTSFDASARLLVDDEDQKMKDIKEYLNRMNFAFEQDEKHTFFSEYALSTSIEDLLFKYLSKKEQTEFKQNYMDGAITAVKHTDYNEILQLKGQKPINLKDNEILVVSNFGKMTDGLDEFMKNEATINIEGTDYHIYNDDAIEENIVTSSTSMYFFYFIIPDNFSGNLHLSATGFNVMYDDAHYEELEEKYSNLFNTFLDNTNIDDSFTLVLGDTIDRVHVRTYGVTATIVFLGVYLGLIFLISSAAVLALQQLSDASESIERYKSLKRIGVTEKSINKAILRQNFIYFFIPLGLAILHSIIGITVVNEIFETYNQGIIGSALFMIAGALIIIYGGYFYATYVGFKNIVKNSH